jgi:hypothetical protein
VKKNSERCKRPVAEGKPLCWQHAIGAHDKWYSRTPTQAFFSWIGIVGVLATFGFGIYSVFQKPASVVHVKSSGDQSPNIVDNSGEVKINNGQPQEQKNKKSEDAKQ